MKPSAPPAAQPAQPGDGAGHDAGTPGRTLHPPRRMRGWISIELGIAIAVVAVMLFFLGPKVQEMFAGARGQQAFTEVNDFILAAERWRSLNGSYTGISIHALGTNGYGFTSQLASKGGTVGAAATAGDNVYGLDMQVAAAGTGGADAAITYTFKDPEPCNQVRERIEHYPQVKGTPACAATTNILTVTIE